jgi:integrase
VPDFGERLEHPLPRGPDDSGDHDLPVGRMPWVSFHTFRHTCASLLFANGKDIKQIQTWLGHANAGFTLHTYVHLLEEGVGSAGFLDDAIRVGRGPWLEDPQGS